MIHVPDRDLGDEEGEGPRRRASARDVGRAAVATARRRRRRPGRPWQPRSADDEAEVEAEVEAEAPETEAPVEAEAPAGERADTNGEPTEADDDASWGYTPMSEWGLDGRVAALLHSTAASRA